MGCARSGGHVVRVVMLQGAVSNMVFKLLLVLGLTYTAVANILLLGLTVSGVVVLSAAVRVSFHYCGMSEIEVTMWLTIYGVMQFGRGKKRLKKNEPINVDAICFTEKGRKCEGSAPSN